MFWLIPALVPGVFILLLFARLVIEINSIENLYRIRFERLASFGMTVHNDAINFELNIFWWKKKYSLDEWLQSAKSAQVNKHNLKGRNKKTFANFNFSKGIKILRSFKIKKCFILFDTGNMPLNGILFPWFYLLSLNINKTFMINFWGENTIVMCLESSLARMLWAYIKS